MFRIWLDERNPSLPGYTIGFDVVIPRQVSTPCSAIQLPVNAFFNLASETHLNRQNRAWMMYHCKNHRDSSEFFRLLSIRMRNILLTQKHCDFGQSTLFLKIIPVQSTKKLDLPYDSSRDSSPTQILKDSNVFYLTEIYNTTEKFSSVDIHDFRKV